MAIYISDREYEIEMRLKEWGSWCRKILEGGLNYPARSVEAKMHDGLSVASRDFIPSHPRAEQIDLMVNQLTRSLTPTHATVLRIKYATGNPLTDELAKIGLPRRTYEIRLKESKIWLMGKIDNFS